MKSHLRKYYFVYIAIFLFIGSMFLWLNTLINNIKFYIAFYDDSTINESLMLQYILLYLFRISFLPLLFLSIYFGVRVKKLSRMVKFDSKEEYEKAIKEKRLKKLEKQKAELQKRIDAETNKE